MPPRTPHTARAADPIYVKVAAEFRRQIENGVLRVGDKLPSIRVLRRGRRISAATAMEAYLRLERDGFVRARDRSGFYVLDPLSSRYPQPEAASALVPPVPVGISRLVAEVLQQTGNGKLVPLGVSTLAPSLLPIPRLNRAFRRALTRWPQHSAAYIGLKGHIALRRQIARRALASGGSSNPEDIIVTGGAMEALNLALRSVAQVGEVIAVESPTYFGVLQALEALGLRAIEVPADYYTGINLELLERAIRKHRVKAVLCMTTCHNPLGSVMSDQRKRELVALTARYQVPLIEDGAYSELVYDETQRRPAKTFDRDGLVLYCGSFSKALAPGLRVGWIEAGRFRDRVEALKGVTSLMTATLPQLAVAELLESGFFQRHVNRLRILLANQNAKYVQALGEVLPPGSRLTRPAGGIPVWVQLPKKVDGTLLYRRLLDENIGVFPGEVFSAGAKHRGFIRVSTGPAWSPAVERALATIGRLATEMA
jgi:DNA-binding transcriptional MocR family regulator